MFNTLSIIILEKKLQLNSIRKVARLQQEEYTKTRCNNYWDNKCIMINFDIQSEGITAPLPTIGLKCKVMSIKEVLTGQ